MKRSYSAIYKGELFESYAHYVADKDGNVDVGHDLSIGGSYSGVEPMGLIWSMKQAPGQKKGIQLFKRDVTLPFDIIVNCFDGHVIPRETSLQPLSSGTFQKSYMADGVKSVPVREGRIRGTLFLPPGDGPFPGIFIKVVCRQYFVLYIHLSMDCNHRQPKLRNH